MIDKAKAYDEALERARKQRDDYQKELDKTDKNSQLASILKAGISAIEMVFPQLIENEDEKFRKYILQCCKECIEANDEGLELSMSTTKKLLAYLEKQKDPKVDIDKLRRDLYQSGYNDGYQHGKEDAQKEQESIPNTYGCLNCTKLEECKKGLTPCSGHRLKIVEQKPVDDKAFEEWIDSWFKEHKEKAYPQITMDEKEFKNFCRGIRNMYQQKPDWNEEDEMMRENIISDLQYFRDCATDEEVVSGYNDEIVWLKDISLNHKKFIDAVDKLWSNEWSEEDEKDLVHIIRILDDCYAFGKHDLSKTDHENLVNKLKSLHSQPKKEFSIEKAIQWLDDTFYFLDNSSGRGRDCEITTHDFDSLEEMYDSFRKAVTVDSEPHWKPSEEQMDALKVTLDYMPDTFKPRCTLMTLQNDLKKFV